MNTLALLAAVEYLRAAAELSASTGVVRIELMTREKGPANAEAEKRLVDAVVASGVCGTRHASYYHTLLSVSRPPCPIQGPLGLAATDPTSGVPETFVAAVAAAGVATVDATRGIEFFLGCKDPEATAQVCGMDMRNERAELLACIFLLPRFAKQARLWHA